MWPEAEKPFLSEELDKRRVKWRRYWNAPLAVALVLVWAPVALYLARELAVSAAIGSQEFIRLPSALFPVKIEQVLSPFVGFSYDLEYYAHLFRRLIGIGAALGLASCYSLKEAAGQAHAERWRELRNAVRHAIYKWTALILLAPSLVSVLVRNVGNRPSVGDVLEVLFPLALIVADWLMLCELMQWLILRFRTKSPLWAFGWSMALVTVTFFANMYIPRMLSRGGGGFEALLPIVGDIFLVTFSLLAALLLFNWTLIPNKDEDDTGAVTQKRFEDGSLIGRRLGEWSARWAHERVAHWPRTLLRIGAIVLLAGWFAGAVERSGVLHDTDVYEGVDLTIPVISTRGYCHYGKPTRQPNSFFFDNVEELPWYSVDVASGDERCPDDIVIVIHGFNNDDRKARYKFDLAKSSLESAGFEGEVIGWSWDSNTQHDPMSSTGYHTGDSHAALNGPKLATFIESQKRMCPELRIHVIGYSMGARVALEALASLENIRRFRADGPRIETVHLCGASVDNEEAELGEKYGAAIEGSCGFLYNYFSERDSALGAFYWMKQADQSLGETGIEHPNRAPQNYADVDAAAELILYDREWKPIDRKLGCNHKGYLGNKDSSGKLLDDGAMNLVAANIADRTLIDTPRLD